jgi:uncharacterized protein YdaU (DUF1376 family)
MAKAPIMPVFTDALIGDTTHLSTEQFGAYVLILIATWRNNGKALPDDDQRMARICRMGVKKWRQKVRNNLVEFFTINDGFWHQHRLEQEFDRVTKLIDVRRALGKAGGKATASKFARSQDGPIQNQTESLPPESPESFAEEGEKNPVMNPEEARCARLGKSPALREKIRDQLVQKCARFLVDRRRPEELAAYWSAMLADDPAAAQRMLDAVDRRMRRANWDDMRTWKHQHGIAA